jgi:Uncharacterised nucleotidyltransferase
MSRASIRTARETFLQVCTVLHPNEWVGRHSILGQLDAGGWETVAKLALDNGVVGLVARSLEWANQRLGVNAPILEQMIAERRRLLIEMMVRRSAARQVGEALAARNIRFVIYKGAVLSDEVYGDLSLRAFGDCDVLVPPNQFEAAYGAVRELGYALSNDVQLEEFLPRKRYDPGMGYEVSMYHPRGFVVDLHWSPFGLELLPKEPEAIWRYCGPPESPTVLPGWRYSPEMTLITSATHLYSHNFQELKPLIDFYVTAVKWEDRIDVDRLFDTARVMEMLPMLDVAARLCTRMFAPQRLIQRIAAGRPSLRARIACATLQDRALWQHGVGGIQRRIRFRRLFYCGTPLSIARAIRIMLFPSAGELEVRFRRPFGPLLYPRFYLLQVYRMVFRSKKPFSAFIAASRRRRWNRDTQQNAQREQAPDAHN